VTDDSALTSAITTKAANDDHLKAALKAARGDGSELRLGRSLPLRGAPPQREGRSDGDRRGG